MTVFKKTLLIFIGIVFWDKASGSSMCRPGWIPLGDRCLFPSKGHLKYQDSSDHCESLHPQGKLMTIHSQIDQDIVLQILLNSKEDSMWIGMSFGSSPRGSDYIWDDGSNVTYTNWGHERQPLTPLIRGRHVAVEAPSGQWFASRGREKKAPLCIAPSLPEGISEKCSAPHEKFTNKSPGCYLVVNQKKTWQEAEDYCKAIQSHLVTVKASEENEALWLDRELNGIPSFWIGLRAALRKSFLRWSDSTHAFYWNWGDHEPLKIPKPRCAAFSTETGEWFVASCEEKKAFICQFKQPERSWEIGPPVQGKCPDGKWRDFGNKYCYYDGHHDKISWNEAHEKCLEMNSNLVSIHSGIENEVLSRLVETGEAWIGILDTFHSGPKWSDWTPLDYKQEFQDIDRPAAQTKCGVLKFSKTWVARGCESKYVHQFICKVEKIS